MKSIRIRTGRERSLLKRHPWVFEGGIERGKADVGETVRVENAGGHFIAWAAYSPQSAIRLRAWSFDEHERIDAAFFARRIAAAVAFRRRMSIASDGVRLVHGESDGLPGLVVDAYGSVLVAQFTSSGVERHKEAIADALLAATGATALYERSDTSSREREGLPAMRGWLRGTGPVDVEIGEHGWRFTVDIATGHKTGFYLDQRDNRARFAADVKRLGIQRVLNCHAYTGGFAVAALSGGARDVVSIDSSLPALERADAHVAANGFEAARHTTVDADVNKTLREYAAAGRRFDAIVLDPPKLAPTVAFAERAARAYKDVNRVAFGLLEPGGLLYTFSCSGGISVDLFHKIVAGAGIDAGIDGAIVARLGAAADHPATVNFPEGEYLKGLAIVRR